MTIQRTNLAQLVHNLRIEAPVTVPILIRSTRHEDLAKLEWYGTYAHFRELFRQTWRDHQAGLRFMLVADCHGFPVGQVWLDVTRNDYAYLYALRVFEPFQNMGLGTQLMQAVEQLATQHNYAEIRLAVERRNTGARRLYERQGYRSYNQRVDLWSYTDQYGKVQWVEEDVYGMHKDLVAGTP